MPVADLLALKLVDFHKMLELLEDDGEPVCDFGVFLVQEESEVGELRTSAANRLIGEVVQSRRRPLLGPSPG